MHKHFLRIVSCLLIPCLAGDALIPAGAATFEKWDAALVADSSAVPERYSQEALTTRLTEFLNAYCVSKHSWINRLAYAGGQPHKHTYLFDSWNPEAVHQVSNNESDLSANQRADVPPDGAGPRSSRDPQAIDAMARILLEVIRMQSIDVQMLLRDKGIDHNGIKGYLRGVNELIAMVRPGALARPDQEPPEIKDRILQLIAGSDKYLGVLRRRVEKLALAPSPRDTSRLMFALDLTRHLFAQFREILGSQTTTGAPRTARILASIENVVAFFQGTDMKINVYGPATDPLAQVSPHYLTTIWTCLLYIAMLARAEKVNFRIEPEEAKTLVRVSYVENFNYRAAPPYAALRRDLTGQEFKNLLVKIAHIAIEAAGGRLDVLEEGPNISFVAHLPSAPEPQPVPGPPLAPSPTKPTDAADSPAAETMALYRQLRDLNIGALLFGNAQANQDAKKRLKRLGCEVYPVRNQKDYQKIMTKVSRFFRSQNAHLAGSLEGKDDHNLVGMAALELAANILVHANSPGFILVRRVETPAGSAIELIAWDQGEKGMNEDAFNRRLGDSGRDQGGDLLKPSGRGLNIAASYAINQGRGWILVETAREGHGKSVLFGQPGLIERGESPITVGTRVTARFFLAASTPGSAREAPGSSWLRRGSVMILFTFLWLSAALAARSAVWWRGPVNPAADMGSPVGFSTPAEPAAFGPNPPGRAGELPALSHKSGQRRSTTAHRWHDEFGLPADSFWMHDPSPLFKQGQLEFIITPSYTYQSLQGFLIRFSILYSSERGLEPTRYSIVCHKQASGGWTKKLYPTRPDADSWPKGIMVEEPPGANSVTVIIPESDILGLEKIYQAQHGSSLLIEFDARKEIATKEIPHEILNPEGDVPVNLYIQSPGKDSPNETPAPAKPDTNAEPRSSDLMPSFGFGWPGILSMGLLLGMMARISGEKPSKKQPAAASSGVAERAVLHLEKTGGRAAPRAGPTVSNPKPNSMRRDPAVRGATQKLPEKLRGSRGMRLDQEPDLASFLEAITRRAQERQKPKSFALHPAAPPAAPLNQSRHRDNAIKRLEEQILPVLSAALGVAEHAIHNFLWSYEPNLRSVVIRGLFDAIQEGRLTTPQDMKDYADSRPSNESLLKAVLKGLLQLSAIAGSVDRPQAQLLRQRFQPGHSMEKLRSSKVPLTGRRKLRRKAMLDPQSHRTRDDKSSSNRKREIFQDRIRDLTKDEEGAAEEATSPTDTAAPRTAGPGPSNVADSAAAPKGLAPMVMESIRSRTIRYYTSDQRGAHIRWFYYHFPNVAIGWYSAFHEWLVSYWLRTWVSGHTNAGWKHWAEGIGIHFASAIPLILAIFNLWHNPNLTHWSYVVASAPFGFALNPIIHGILDTLAAINKWLMQRLEKAWPQAGTVARAMTLAYAVMDKEPDGDSAPDGTRGFRFDRRSFLAALGVGIAGSIGVVVFHKWFGALGSQRPPWQSYEQFESLRFWADIMQLDRDPEFVDDATYNHDQAVTKQGDHEWRDALRKFYRDYHPVLKEILEIESSPVVELARSFGVFPAAATMPEVLSQESQDILNRWLRARSRQQALLVELNDRLLLPRGWCVFGEGNTSGFALARVVGREDFVQTTELRHGGRRSRPVTLIKGEVFDAHTGTFVNRSDSAGSEWGFLFMGVPNRGLIFEDAATFVGRTLKIRKLVESPETPADPDEQLTGVYYRAALIRDGFFKNGRLADDWEKTYEKVAIDHEFTHSALMWDSAADPRTTLQEAFAHAGELMSALQTMFLSQLSIQGVRDVEIRQGLAKGSIHAGMMRASYSMLIVASLAAQLNLHRDAIGILEAKSNKVGEVIAAVARRNHDAISALARGIQQDIGSTLDAPLRWWVDKQITDPRLLPPSPPCHSAKLGANPKASPKSEAIALAAALGIGLAVVPSSVLQQHLTAVVLALMTAVASAVYAATDAIPLLGTVATSAVNVFKAVARPTTAATRRIHSLLAAA